MPPPWRPAHPARVDRDDLHLLVLPESGAALLVWPEGRAVRVERDGATTPPLAALTAPGSVDTVAAAQQRPKAARAPRAGEEDVGTPSTAAEFVKKWRRIELKERSAAQAHFRDLCHILGEPTPEGA